MRNAEQPKPIQGIPLIQRAQFSTQPFLNTPTSYLKEKRNEKQQIYFEYKISTQKMPKKYQISILQQPNQKIPNKFQITISQQSTKKTSNKF